jgi:hypothetical protein
LIADGPGFALSTGNALHFFNKNLYIGFLNSSFFAITTNSVFFAAIANKKGSHHVRCGAAKI